MSTANRWPSPPALLPAPGASDMAPGARLVQAPWDGWQWRGWASSSIVAGVTSRRIEAGQLLNHLAPGAISVTAEQVHGASLACVGHPAHGVLTVAGCDALLTSTPGAALLIRTADCVPVFFAAAARPAVGLAHAGWRGLATGLLPRMVAAFRHAYQISAEALTVAIGPAIRACCYQVGEEFSARFPGHVTRTKGHWMCDLIGVAIEQLRASGVPARAITDAGVCTACGLDTWFSLRKEGQATGRLVSMIAIQP